MRRLAYEEAARLYRLALTVGADDIDDDRRCRLLLGIAGALKAAGELSGRLPACREAAALARRSATPGPARRGGAGDGGRRIETSRPRHRCERRAKRHWLRCLRRRVPCGPRCPRTSPTACMYLGDLEAAGRASAHALAMADRSGDPACRGRGAAGPSAGGVRAGGDGGAGDARRPDGRRRSRGRDPALGCGGTCGGSMWRSSAAISPPSAGSWNRSRTASAELRTPVARWHLLQARAVLAQALGRFADARLLADRAVAALPPSATGRESAQINRTALLSLIGLHTGEASDLTGLLDYGPGHEDGDGLDFPIEGVIFSIAAAFFLAHGGSAGPGGDRVPPTRPPGDLAADSPCDDVLLRARDRHGHRAGRVRRRGGAARAARSLPRTARRRRRRGGGLQRAGRAVPGIGRGTSGPARRRRGRSGGGVTRLRGERGGRFRRPVPVRAGQPS